MHYFAWQALGKWHAQKDQRTTKVEGFMETTLPGSRCQLEVDGNESGTSNFGGKKMGGIWAPICKLKADHGRHMPTWPIRSSPFSPLRFPHQFHDTGSFSLLTIFTYLWYHCQNHHHHHHHHHHHCMNDIVLFIISASTWSWSLRVWHFGQGCEMCYSRLQMGRLLRGAQHQARQALGAYSFVRHTACPCEVPIYRLRRVRKCGSGHQWMRSARPQRWSGSREGNSVVFCFFIGVSGPSTKGPGLHVEPRPVQCLHVKPLQVYDLALEDMLQVLVNGHFESTSFKSILKYAWYITINNIQEHPPNWLFALVAHFQWYRDIECSLRILRSHSVSIQGVSGGPHRHNSWRGRSGWHIFHVVPWKAEEFIISNVTGIV